MDSRIRHVIELLQDAWRRTVRVNELALCCGLGASRLEHLFKHETNMSIREFVRERRLAEAARLLACTDDRVTTISFDAGFPDISHFNHAFKKRFGLSPLRYRATTRKGARSAG